jgi:hypothetical protein
MTQRLPTFFIVCLVMIISPSQSFADAGIVSPDVFRAGAIEFCKKKHTPNLIKSCILNAAKTFNFVVSNSSDKERKVYIPLCKKANFGIDGEQLVFHTILCAEKNISIYRKHPYPDLIPILLQEGEFRPYWVSRCAQKFGKKISDCVSLQKLGFSMFSSDYLSAESAEEAQLVADCLDSADVRKTDFSQYEMCRR